MNDVFLGLSQDTLFYHGNNTRSIRDMHKPYFLAFTHSQKTSEHAQKKLQEQISNNPDHSVLSKIDEIGACEHYNSFSSYGVQRTVFPVYTKKSYFVPEVSDYLFFHHHLFTAEHDIPYQQRAVTDLAADNTLWLFDTHGKKTPLKIMVYDIETTEFEEGKREVPIDIIGLSSFSMTIQSEKNIESEDFSFEILDTPSDWQHQEIQQLVSHNVDEEVHHLYDFCKQTCDVDIISGHNILGFDNAQLRSRIQWMMHNKSDSISSKERQIFELFLNKHCQQDKSFHFGVGNEVTQWYPSSFDTYLAMRKFYSFLDEFSLKAVAPFLGIHITDRVYLTPSQMKLDNQTLKYNLHDVQEQLGVTLHLLQLGLPLAFTTCMPFDLLLPAGAVNMWDHMSMLRAKIDKKIMPPICRVKSITGTLLSGFSQCTTKEQIVTQAKKHPEQLSKDFKRVVKYGDEMPSWVEYPYVIMNPKGKDADQTLGYHMPGGMTIKPDKDAQSHFVPWYHVVVADVGAMYPTILKAMNIGADTVRLALSDEKPDEWVWLKRLPEQLFHNHDLVWKEVGEDDHFADKGFLIGVKIDEKPGVVNRSMTGIMNMIAKIKLELQQAQKTNDREELERLQMMYQSMKGARNAGTHGILSAPGVTGRQFNLWGAATITTKGQLILYDTLSDLEKKKIRVVYGDTDGIYLGCSQSIGNVPKLALALGASVQHDERKWLTKPQDAIAAIAECNEKWRDLLNYAEFELEPEVHDAMLFVKHKNYLIFDTKEDMVELITKGNNFKGSDKANIARSVLETIMMQVLRDVPVWGDEEEARKKIKERIIAVTQDVLATLDLSRVDMDELTLVQSVQPSKRYKCNQDGSLSTFGKRAKALETVLGHPIRSRVKLRFVVTKQPLPGITKPSKSGVKPIDYMYPVDHLRRKEDIDLEWYKKMIENYIQGAFGLSGIAATEQTGLDAWM